MGRSIRTAIIGLAIVLLAGLYTWQSLAYWQTYDTRLSRQQRTLQALKDQALGADSNAEQLSAVRELDDALQSRGQFCRVNPLFGWQAWVIPALRDGVRRCNQTVERLDPVASSLHDLRQYLEVTTKLQATLSALTSGEPLKPAEWASKGLEQARKTQTAIKDLKADGDGAKLQAQAARQVDTLVAAWQRLIAANEQKDLDSFTAGSSAVMKAYADLMSLADTADTMITQKVERLTKVSDAL